MSKPYDMYIIVPHIKPKYKQATDGVFVHMEGRWSFRSGNTTVYINERFPANGAAPEKLVENIIRYDDKNNPNQLENDKNLCYDISVNDVL